MSKASKTATARAAGEKEKKQRKILIVSSVLFLALLGFQLPKLMHGAGGGGGGGQAAAPPADTSVVPAAPIAVPSSGALPDTDRVTVTPGSGQLVSFGLFKSKDPFVQQLAETTAGGITPLPETTPETLPAVTTPEATTQPVTTPTSVPRRTAPNGGLTPVTTPTLTTPSAVPAIPGVNMPTTPSLPSTTPLSTTPVSTTPLSTTPVSTTPVSTKPVSTKPATTTTTAKPAAAPTSVSISTNSLCEVVAVNATFPAQEDIFRVLSIAKDGKSAKIGIVGGAYDSGAAAITLELGKKLTLVNTADGSRYVLILKSRCDTQTTPVGGAAATTATTPTSTVAPPTTTTSATTPIVTDALDTTTPTP